MPTVHAIAVLHARGMSIRKISKKLMCSRNTVRRYLRGAEPGVRAKRSYERPAREAIEARALELLETSRTTAKQRWTAPRLAEVLREEGLDASERTVQRILKEWRRQHAEVAIPLQYAPGDLAQVDFFQVEIIVAGERLRAFLFLMRLMHSGCDFAWLYRWQDTACFLDGHVRAFARFGGLPGRVLYDNLRPAVRKVLIGSERELATRFAKFATYYGLDPRFARPRRGSDKGGVEARGKGIRLQHLTPLPEGDTLDELNHALLRRLERGLERARVRGGPTCRSLWEVEAASLRPLPEWPGDASVLIDAVADRQAKVRVKPARYSVPCGWHRLPVQARLYADRVVLSRDGETVEHPRVAGNQSSIWYPHYLPELCRKPHAIEQVGTSLSQQLGSPFDTLWARLCAIHGRRAAARRFKSVLVAIRDDGVEVVAGRVRKAIEEGNDAVLSAPRDEESGENRVPARLATIDVEGPELSRFDNVLQVDEPPCSSSGERAGGGQ